MQRFLIGVVLADFVALNAYAVTQFGYLGLFQQLFANSATIAVTVDLTIALGLVAIWLVRDARQRGVTSAPYLALTALLGSAGPLLYLLLRREEPAHATPAGVAARA